MAKAIYLVTPNGEARERRNRVERMIVVAQSEDAAKTTAAADSDAGNKDPWLNATATLLDPSALDDNSVQAKGF
jgi:hypothetical protein